MKTYELECFRNWSIQHGLCRPNNCVYNFEVTDSLGDRLVVAFLFPGFFISRFAGTDGILTFEFSPTGPETTHQRLVYFGRGEEMSAVESATMAYFNDVLGPEDVDLVESVQKGLHSLGYHQGRFMIDAGTVGEALDELVRLHPPIRESIFDDSDHLVSFVGIFVGGQNIRDLDNESTQLRDSDEILLVPAIAGG